MLDTEVRLGQHRLRNPITLASGTAGYGAEVEEWYELDKLGGFFSKAVTLEPRVGNRQPRICEVPTGMLNSIGLANPGLERFISEQLPWWAERDTLFFVNVAGSTSDDYVTCCRRLSEYSRIDGLEINVSCPNVKRGGIGFSADLRELGSLLSRCREATDQFMIVKLSPQVTDVTEVARVCADNGADALSLINTIPGMSIDVNTRRPRLSTYTGGYSGPGVKPVAVAQVYRVAQAVSLPLIGIGGISSAEDIIELMLAGATVVQLGTCNFVDPMAGTQLLAELELLCERLGIGQLSSIVGALEPPLSE